MKSLTSCFTAKMFFVVFILSFHMKNEFQIKYECCSKENNFHFTTSYDHWKLLFDILPSLSMEFKEY